MQATATQSKTALPVNGTAEYSHRRQYDVRVEPVDDLFRASVLAWAGFSVEAPTREEAIQRAQSAIVERLAQEDIVTLEVDRMPENKPNPLLKFAGIYADDPDYDEFLAEIENYRRQIDAEHQYED